MNGKKNLRKNGRTNGKYKFSIETKGGSFSDLQSQYHRGYNASHEDYGCGRSFE